MSDHPSRPAVAGRLKRPTRRHRAGRPRTPAQGRVTPSWSCSGWGLPSRPGRPGRWWSLTPPFHPYPAYRGAVCFLWHCPAGHPGLPLTTTLPCGVRTFLGACPHGARRRGRPANSSARTGYAHATHPRANGRLAHAATMSKGALLPFGDSKAPLLSQGGCFWGWWALAEVGDVVDEPDGGVAVGVEVGDRQRGGVEV